MMSQPEFDRACALMKECLQEALGGWRSVSVEDLDGGFTRKFTFWTALDQRLGGPDLIAQIFVSKKTIDIDPVDKDSVHDWLVRQFPGLRIVRPIPIRRRA